MDTGTELWGRIEGRYIETASGNRFYFSAPVFNAEDCAAATSKICRYTGHCKNFYSVAEHQILVSEIMEYLNLGDPFEGCNHDAAEYVLGDVSSPLKSVLPDYKGIERRIDEAFREQLGLPLFITEGCKKADWLALFIEARVLVPTAGKDWIAPPGIWNEAQELASRLWVRCWTPKTAEREWMARYKQLSNKRASKA